MNSLTAQLEGRRVTIGLDSPEELRSLSDSRALTCPGCGAPVVLHAGTVRAHHFAHLPGAVCSLPASEPETEEHRAGKLLIAEWLRERLPEAEVIVEAHLPETGQRADVLTVLPGRLEKRFALEFQCADLSAREWRRRHRLYRESGIQDLWLLGGSRLHQEGTTLRTSELERAFLWDNAPLLFLDSIGESLTAGSLARFRPEADAQPVRPSGKLSVRDLRELAFPYPLFGWPETLNPMPVPVHRPPDQERRFSAVENRPPTTDLWLWEWLKNRHRVSPEALSDFFGQEIAGEEAFACDRQTWQAALYYRFIHRHVGDGWWLGDVEVWARAYVPLSFPFSLSRLRKALSGYQELLAAAGFLSLPVGYGRRNARIVADLTTLAAPPNPQEAQRLARYRRTLHR